MTPREWKEFCKAGRAQLFLQSTVSGRTFKYRINKGKYEGVFFVKNITETPAGLLIGTIKNDKFYSGIFADAKYYPALAFDYFWFNLNLGLMHPQVKVFHAGRCARCGRELTDPMSVERGFGPECWEKCGGI